ncbi:brain-specific angiogenesis inhibitor 1-associated protein 2-like protein 1 isoform X2 [Rissa tridactyla]|uniref:brain-specific angiogenesis inhibitor 1-associated protein 2-like protein 1 isoform X2 n=1 Tax=Rissa tridactyla TaxID=75485 RepID=UPI0023BAAE2D|nr:brain-specific angiogenesis inhibitor 1-associated protein 2-like protein 1 isoform X2 [Rissa tridactyla]
MSRDPEEVNRLTESTYKNVMEQFNPGLRNLINLGKNYEKAVNAMVVAGRAYYDSLAKIGDISADSPVSKELGQVLIEISRTHKKLNDSLEESFKKFHKEIISELEKKTDLDVKYMNATLKRYQTEHRSKLDSLEKSQAELKKIRRKSQGARNVLKYEHKEMEYLETVSSRQSDIQRFIAEGCREALLEEKRRFCFLVDKHCSFTQHMHFYHVQCADFLKSKLPGWQEICSDATKVPEKVRMMIDEIRTPGSTPQPSPMIERNTTVPPAPTGRAYTSPLVDMFNNPATVPKTSSEKLNNSAENSDDASLSRSTSVATGLNIMKRQKVKTIFPHTAGSNKTLLSFAQGDIITLLVAEEKDGWLYGEHDSTKVKGWFPSSYTRPLEEPAEEKAFVPVPSPAPIRSISSVNLVEKGDVVLPPPDYLGSVQTDKRMEPSKGTTVKTPSDRPENAGPKPDVNGIVKPPFLSGENPFATVKLRPTVTNDRSAPIIR